MSAKKTERLLNLVICLLATRRFLAVQEMKGKGLDPVETPEEYEAEWDAVYQATRGIVAEEAAAQGITAWHLSLSHDGGVATAVVVAES